MRHVALLLAILCACQKTDSQPAADQKVVTGSGSKFKVEQVPPPVDLKTPPGDAIKTSSGLIYKKLQTNDAGTAPKRNDTVLINYTGWKQSTGETFYTKNEIYEGSTEDRTVFDQDGADDRLKDWIGRHRGTRQFFIYERGQQGHLQGMLPAESRDSFKVLDSQNNKFSVAQADL